jgi:hypothetical protein
MWRYNFRNGPNYPWRNNLDIDIGLSLQSRNASLSAATARVPSQLESTQQPVYEHLAERNNYTSSLSTTRNESAVSCFELEDLDIMMSLSMTHGTDRAPFTGSTTSGPRLAHLEQDFLALKSEIKLKNATNLNANDMFNFIGKMLAGGATDQFLALRRQFDEKLRVKNAAASALYDRNRAVYDQAKIRWDALDAVARVGQVKPQAHAAHVDSEEYDRSTCGKVLGHDEGAISYQVTQSSEAVWHICHATKRDYCQFGTAHADTKICVGCPRTDGCV